MIGAKGLFANGQRALAERLGCGVVVSSGEYFDERRQAPCHVGMIRAKGLLLDCQRPLAELLGPIILVLGV